MGRIQGNTAWGEPSGPVSVGVGLAEDSVGWVNTVRYVLSEWTGNPIAFKPATFYLEVVSHRARRIGRA